MRALPILLLCLLAAPAAAQIVNNHFESSQDSVRRMQEQQEFEREMWEQSQRNQAEQDAQAWRAAQPPDPREEQRRIDAAFAAMRDDVARRRDWWGAAVLDIPTGTWHLGRWQPSSAGALSTAAKACAGEGCRALAMLRNTCIAAAGSRAGALVWADDTDPEDAQRAALRACKAGGGECAPEPELTVCTGYRHLPDRPSGWRPGRADIAEAEVRWNRPLRELLAMPAAERVAAAARRPPVPARAWTAIARNPQGQAATSTGFSADEAKQRILSLCGDPACEVVAVSDRPLCYATGAGLLQQPIRTVPVLGTGATADAATRALDAECKRLGASPCAAVHEECVGL